MALPGRLGFSMVLCPGVRIGRSRGARRLFFLWVECIPRFPPRLTMV
jgi:hypothetical protein